MNDIKISELQDIIGEKITYGEMYWWMVLSFYESNFLEDVLKTLERKRKRGSLQDYLPQLYHLGIIKRVNGQTLLSYILESEPAIDKIELRELSQVTISVWLYISEDGLSSLKHFSEKYRISISSIRKAITELTNIGALKDERKPNYNTYEKLKLVVPLKIKKEELQLIWSAEQISKWIVQTERTKSAEIELPNELKHIKRLGIVRLIDEGGRYTLPAELLETLNIEPNRDYVVVSNSVVENKYIILKKQYTRCELCGTYEDLVRFKGKKICRKCIFDL